MQKIISKYICWIASLAILFLSGITCKSLDSAKLIPPNILFIAVDDLRPELNCYGQQHIHSPHIDRLASQGTIFKRNYCQVPVCGASRASLLCGVRPTSTRFVDYTTRMDEDFPGAVSLPEHFKQNGYTTVSLGKIFHNADDQLSAWSRAPWSPTTANAEYGWFDYADSNSLSIIRSHPEFKEGADWSKMRGPAFEYPDVTDTAYKDGKLAEKAIQELNAFAKEGKPFFLAVGFWKPHLPFNAPKKYWDLYDPGQIPMSPNAFVPQNAPDEAIHTSGELRNYALIPRKGPVSRDTARLLTHGYYACISYTDAQIGKLLDVMTELNLLENTIIVLWGDHGWNLEDHTMWCKHANFESSMRAPLIISAPGYFRKQETRALTEFVDIYPTLCELADLPKPNHLDGQSLVPLLENPNQNFKEAIFSRFHKGESIKTDQFVYTEWIDPENGEVISKMLYDHAKDPLENINVVMDSVYTEVQMSLSFQLSERRKLSEAKLILD
jgi:arylsulfatase A-like enzyme